jgi:hypothetical protein
VLGNFPPIVNGMDEIGVRANSEMVDANKRAHTNAPMRRNVFISGAVSPASYRKFGPFTILLVRREVAESHTIITGRRAWDGWQLVGEYRPNGSASELDRRHEGKNSVVFRRR